MNGYFENHPSLMHRLLVVFCSAAAVAVSGVTLISPASAQSISINDPSVPPPPPPFIPVPIVPTPVPTPTDLLTLDGTDYNVRVETGAFSGQLAMDVESSPWWNSSSTAQTVADLVGLDGNDVVGPSVAYFQEEIDIPCFGGPGTCNAPPPFAGVLFWRSQFSCFLFSCGMGADQGFADVASEHNYLVASPAAGVPEPSEILGLGVAAGWLGTVILKRKRKLAASIKA